MNKKIVLVITVLALLALIAGGVRITGYTIDAREIGVLTASASEVFLENESTISSFTASLGAIVSTGGSRVDVAFYKADGSLLSMVSAGDGETVTYFG